MQRLKQWQFWKWTWREWKNTFLGMPLSTPALKYERLSNPQGLSIFSSDALSSVAYSTEEILLVLVMAGASGYITAFSWPIALAIATLIILVSLSYYEIIHAYPQGGGVYNVAQKNLGGLWALVGAASLLIDYVLTVSVSVAAGVAGITSALPALMPHRIMIGAGIIVFLMWANLRGVRESGRMFVFPPYVFIFSFLGMIGYGIWQHVFGNLSRVAVVPVVPESGALLGSIGIILILRAFASGCTALTGIEATSNGVQAFREPAAENASKTLLRMSVILAVVFVGITLLASWIGVLPREGETVVSQIARSLFGRDWRYFLIQGSTVAILLLAANTPFADFPRVVSQLSRDGYFPSQFKNIGARGVFANGIIALSLVSLGLLYLFGGDVHALIPLYAVGVFLGFSISQYGMIRHWAREGVRSHLKSIAINAVGFAATSIVFLVVLVSKFTHGAWILIPVGLLLVFGMKRIKRHYEEMRCLLALDASSIPPMMDKKTIVLLVSDVNYVAKYGLRVAKSYKPEHLCAMHVWTDEEEKEHFKKWWEIYGGGVDLDLVLSEYRDIITPIIAQLKTIKAEHKNEGLIVLIPELIPPGLPFWQLFHNRTARLIRDAIRHDQELECEIREIPVKVPARF
ncbi:MAG: APC family permease [bacterium]|nr:APC family permease [bacterium]